VVDGGEHILTVVNGRPPAVKINALATFATQLTRYRERREWTQAQLAQRLGFSPSLVSSVVNLDKVPSLQFAQKCDGVFGLEGTFEAFHDLASREALPSYFAPAAEFESAAVRIHEYELRAVPGLLQTEEYARCVIQAGQPRTPQSELDRKVGTRMERQRILSRTDPPHYWTVIHEAVLRQNVGGPGVMGPQLDRIAEAAEGLHVIVQVLPLSASIHPGTDGPFAVFDLSVGRSTAYAEGKGGGRISEASEEVAELVTTLNLIRVAAMHPSESLTLLRQLRGEIRG